MKIEIEYMIRFKHLVCPNEKEYSVFELEEKSLKLGDNELFFWKCRNCGLAYTLNYLNFFNKNHEEKNEK